MIDDNETVRVLDTVNGNFLGFTFNIACKLIYIRSTFVNPWPKPARLRWLWIAIKRLFLVWWCTTIQNSQAEHFIWYGYFFRVWSKPYRRRTPLESLFHLQFLTIERAANNTTNKFEEVFENALAFLSSPAVYLRPNVHGLTFGNAFGPALVLLYSDMIVCT